MSQDPMPDVAGALARARVLTATLLALVGLPLLIAHLLPPLRQVVAARRSPWRRHGTRDVTVVAAHPIEADERGRCEFGFDLPSGPPSFSGRLISLIWDLELVTVGGGPSTRGEIVVAPNARALHLGASSDA